MRRSFVSTALLLLGMVSPLFANSPAQVPYWTGRLEQDTTWRDTVYVGGDVTIAAAATLTLAPKTQVLFLPYRDETRGGLDSTRAEMIVEGRLAAHAGGIVFSSTDTGSLGADWYGLVVKQGGRADVSHAAIRDGLRCVYAKRGGRVTMDALAFANCGKPTALADAAKPAGTERKEDLELSHPRETKITPPMNQPFEIQEITIHGGHKGVVLALLEAVDAGTPVTGIAELDSLAAIYGLIGIYRTGGRASGLYGYRFRLTFPPGADVAAMAKAYGNLSYIQSIKSVDSSTMKGMHPSFGIENAGLRLLAKMIAGTGSGIAATILAVGVLDQIYGPLSAPDANADIRQGFVLAGGAIGCSAGFPLGVSLVDPYDSLPKTLLAGVIPGAVGFSLLLNQADAGIGFLFTYVVPVISSPIMSELSRKPPQNSRVSFALSPTLNGGLSAVAQLRF